MFQEGNAHRKTVVHLGYWKVHVAKAWKKPEGSPPYVIYEETDAQGEESLLKSQTTEASNRLRSKPNPPALQ